jgi:hypothetical protein
MTEPTCDHNRFPIVGQGFRPRTGDEARIRFVKHLETGGELVERQEAEARDKIWRENFHPHAIILTARTVPSPIFVAAIIGVEKLLRIDLDATQGPVSFVRQVLDRLPDQVPAFGKPIGFVIIIPLTRQSGSIQLGSQSRSWIGPFVPGPPSFSLLGGVRSLPFPVGPAARPGPATDSIRRMRGKMTCPMICIL